MRKTQTFVSLFSGCGGMDLGFEQAGFTGLLACDIDPLVISVHDTNLNGRAAVLDLSRVPSGELAGLRPDVVIAGLPWPDEIVGVWGDWVCGEMKKLLRSLVC